MNGWMGKILQVDLSTGEITELSTLPYAGKYLGGRGIATKLYWEKVEPGAEAFDPDNRLIFMTGPIVGAGVQAASRLSVVGKSPMAYPEGFCYGNMGGFVSAELKKAGFDGVVIDGRAPHPVYLWINDNEVELKDASSLWGKNNYETGELLKQIHGEKVCFITTGVAGENKVRTAIVFASHEAAAAPGFGGVMGAKNFKALAVKGSGKPSVSNPDMVKELNRYVIKIAERPKTKGLPPLVVMTHRDNLVEVVSKGGCYQCSMDCLRGKKRFGGTLVGYRKCQPIEYYLPWRYNREDEPIETWFKAAAMANDYGLETWELGSMIDWLFACYQSGALNEQETGLPLSRIGTSEFLEKLLHSIAYREGFGDLLAEGLWRTGEKVSRKARNLFTHSVAPIGQGDIFAPRGNVVYGLLYSLEPRIHHNLFHQASGFIRPWAMNLDCPGSTPVNGKVLRDITAAFWGSTEASNISSYEGKALAAKKIQDRTYIKESLGLCDFVYPVMWSFNTPDYVGDPNLEAKIFNAVTGVLGDNFEQYGERIANLQRLILLREGRRLPDDDYPLDYNFTEPLETNQVGQKIVVPGPGGEAVDMTGNTLDREKFKSTLEEYYSLRGWDRETGIPLASTLKALQQDDLIV